MTNKTSLFLSFGLLLTLGLSSASCGRVYDEPLLTEPASTLSPNITISELKEKYSAATQDNSLSIDTDYILKATVGGNDESGNIYKTLWVQDETGGMPIAIDMSNMSTEYMVGQELLIKLKGLSINVYGGVQQIGYKEAGSKNTRIPQALFKAIAERNGFPNIENVKPVVISLSDLKDSMIGQVVEFRDVAWKEAGEVFAVKDENTNRTLTDGSKTLIVRNSGYSSFAGEKLPEGIGTVRGILSKFGRDYQLFLRNRDDVQAFRPGTPSGSNPSIPGTPTPNPGTPTPDPGTPTPNPNVPGEQGAGAILLFPGSDFDSKADFGKFGLTGAAIEDKAGMKDTKGLHVTVSQEERAGYIFSTQTKNFEAGKKYSKISFYLKGKATGSSLSINVYETRKDAKGKLAFYGFNLGNVAGNVLVKNSGTTATKEFVNNYKGSIDTKGQWVLVTLDISGIDLNTSGKDNTFAVKFGGKATYDLFIDNIKIE